MKDICSVEHVYLDGGFKTYLPILHKYYWGCEFIVVHLLTLSMNDNSPLSSVKSI